MDRPSTATLDVKPGNSGSKTGSPSQSVTGKEHRVTIENPRAASASSEAKHPTRKEESQVDDNQRYFEQLKAASNDPKLSKNERRAIYRKIARHVKHQARVRDLDINALLAAPDEEEDLDKVIRLAKILKKDNEEHKFTRTEHLDVWHQLMAIMDTLPNDHETSGIDVSQPEEQFNYRQLT